LYGVAPPPARERLAHALSQLGLSGRRARTVLSLILVALIAVAGLWASGAFGTHAGAASVSIDDFTAHTGSGGALTMTARLRNNSAVVANVSSLWSLAPTDAKSPWDSRVYEGPTGELVVPAAATRAQHWTGRVDPPAGTYRVTVWVRILAHGVWTQVDSITSAPLTFGADRLGVVRFRTPAGPALVLRRARTTSGASVAASIVLDARNPQAAPVWVTVVWGLEPVGSPHGMPWFDHPVVPSGTPTSVRIPARATIAVAVAGNGFAPAGDYYVRVAMQTDRVPPPRSATSDASLSYRTDGPVADDMLLSGSEAVVRATAGLTREQAPAGPLAVTSVAVKTTPRTGAPTTVIVTVLNTGQRSEKGSVFAILGGAGEAEPWKAATSRVSPARVVAVPPRSTVRVRLWIPRTGRAGEYEVSAWVHGASARTAQRHVDGVSLAEAVEMRP
jgi:hypothetical protein